MNFAKLVLPLALLGAVSTHQVEADARLDCKPRTEAMNVLTDVIVVRPLGAVLTLAGDALFVGLSPLTALASIPPPHDAFQRFGAIVVGIPYGYTFIRPLGEFSDTCQ